MEPTLGFDSEDLLFGNRQDQKSTPTRNLDPAPEVESEERERLKLLERDNREFRLHWSRPARLSLSTFRLVDPVAKGFGPDAALLATPLRPTWEELVAGEPRLLHVLAAAPRIGEDRGSDPRFCAG